MANFRGYRIEREEELKAKWRKQEQERKRKKWLEKQKNYKIRDNPLDNRI